METTIVYWGYNGIMKSKKETTGIIGAPSWLLGREWRNGCIATTNPSQDPDSIGVL